MAHLVTPMERELVQPEVPSSDFCAHLLVEGAYIVASVIFVVGTVLFWPHLTLPESLDFVVPVHNGMKSPLALGCHFFDVGSVMFALLSAYSSLSIKKQRKDAKRGATDQMKVIEPFSAVRRCCAEATQQMFEINASNIDRLKPLTGKTLKVLNWDEKNRVATCLFHGGEVLLPLAALEHPKKRVLMKMIIEQRLYLTGSMVFCMGTLIWDPTLREYFGGRHIDHEQWLAIADILFMAGSLVFSLAAYVNALTIYVAHTCKIIRFYALATATGFAFGGFCFIAGTMCFIPSRYVVRATVERNGTVAEGLSCRINLDFMEMIGCCFYLVGSALYLGGSIVSLMRTCVEHKIQHERAERLSFEQARLRSLAAEREKKMAKALPDHMKETLKDMVLRHRKRRAKLDGHPDELVWGHHDENLAAPADAAEARWGQESNCDWSALMPLFSEDDDDEDDWLDERGFFRIFWQAIKPIKWRRKPAVQTWLPSDGALGGRSRELDRPLIESGW